MGGPGVERLPCPPWSARSPAWGAAALPGFVHSSCSFVHPREAGPVPMGLRTWAGAVLRGLESAPRRGPDSSAVKILLCTFTVG